MESLTLYIWRLRLARALSRRGLQETSLRIFYSPGNKKRAWKAPDSGNEDSIHIAHVRVRRGDGRVVVTWQVISVSRSGFEKLRKLAEEERDGVKEAMAEAFEDQFWDLLTHGWFTVDAGDFAALTDAISAVQEELKRYLIGGPATFAGTALGLADLSLVEAIAERVPIPGLDRSLGDLRHYAEIAGIVLVVLTGGHILACASFKLWVHDKLGQYLTKLLDKFLRGLGGTRVRHSPPGDDPSAPGYPDERPPSSGPSSDDPPDPGPRPPDDRDPPSSGPGPFPGPAGGFPRGHASRSDREPPTATRPHEPPAAPVRSEPAADSEPARAAAEPVTQVHPDASRIGPDQGSQIAEPARLEPAQLREGRYGTRPRARRVRAEPGLPDRKQRTEVVRESRESVNSAFGDPSPLDERSRPELAGHPSDIRVAVSEARTGSPEMPGQRNREAVEEARVRAEYVSDPRLEAGGSCEPEALLPDVRSAVSEVQDDDPERGNRNRTETGQEASSPVLTSPSREARREGPAASYRKRGRGHASGASGRASLGWSSSAREVPKRESGRERDGDPPVDRTNQRDGRGWETRGGGMGRG